MRRFPMSPLARQLRGVRSVGLAASLFAGFLATGHAATIEIQSRDAPGVGFNDPTPVAPVGGNAGRTLGEQRLNVYQYVASIWERALDSDVKITVNAGWEPLSCDEFGAVLGSASPYNVWYDFPNAPVAGTWYPQALANKLSGRNLPDFFGQEDDGSGYGNVDIKTQFNVSLGQPGCLTGTGFYLGLDGQAGTQINFATTLLHELGHGLGFSLLTTNASTGTRFQARPSIWENFMFDNTVRKTWLSMSDAERRSSGINPQQLSWTGPASVAAVPKALARERLATVVVAGAGAGAAAGSKPIGIAEFGPPLGDQPVSGPIVRVVDQTDGTGLACTALSAANAGLVMGKVALIDRGGCAFAIKVKNLQQAGAKAALIADNVVAELINLSGADPSITIPSARLRKADGDAIKAALLNRVRGRPAPEIIGSLSARLTGRFSGADGAGRPLLYSPADFRPGSSVSHWDTTLTPNALMEPVTNPDLTNDLTAPRDLTVPLLKDIGW